MENNDLDTEWRLPPTFVLALLRSSQMADVEYFSDHMINRNENNIIINYIKDYDIIDNNYK